MHLFASVAPVVPGNSTTTSEQQTLPPSYSYSLPLLLSLSPFYVLFKVQLHKNKNLAKFSLGRFQAQGNVDSLQRPPKMLKSLPLSPHPGSASHLLMACLSIGLFLLSTEYILSTLCVQDMEANTCTSGLYPGLKPTKNAEVSPVHPTFHQASCTVSFLTAHWLLFGER